MKYLLFYLAFIVACSSNVDQKNAVNLTDTTEPLLVKATTEKPDSISVETKLYTNLSYTYDYKLSYKVEYIKGLPEDATRIVEIYNKNKGLRVDSIALKVSTLIGYLEGDDETRSYITGKDSRKEFIDNYAGHFVVADLNFDGQEDFAIVSDIGASSGPFCTFFVQNNNGKFIKDNFLTDSVTVFPDKIIPASKKIITYIHANAYQIGENVYQFNSSTSKWKEISHRYVNY